MASFNLWCAYWPTHDQIEFDVTMADADLIGSGTISFIQTCLEALEEKRRAVRWELECVRQRYFSDYLFSDDWRARWDLAWQARVWLDGPPTPRVQRLPPLPVQIDAPADCSPESDEPRLDRGPVLLLANLSIERSNEGKALLVQGLREHVPHASMDVASREYDSPRVAQLRIRLGLLQLPSDLPKLDTVLGNVERIGAVVSWQDQLRLFGSS